MEPIVFVPLGPFGVPVEVRPRARLIASPNEIANWWGTLPLEEAGQMVGVYVFSLRAGKGYTPYYVGKTSRQDFAHECFTADKRNKYNTALAEQAGAPVMHFIAYPRRRGALSHSAIAGLELELINVAFERNPGLLNERGIQDPPVYSIAGALRPGRGKPSSDAVELRRVLGLR